MSENTENTGALNTTEKKKEKDHPGRFKSEFFNWGESLISVLIFFVIENEHLFILILKQRSGVKFLSVKHVS